MPDTITLPPVVVTARRIPGGNNSFVIQYTRRQWRFSYNEATGGMEAISEEVTEEIINEGTPPKPPVININNNLFSVAQVNLSTCYYWVDGYLMMDIQYVYTDNTTYTTTVTLGPSGEWYARTSSGTKVSYDRSKTWQSYSGAIPRISIAPSGPSDEDSH